jgi:hypothetical protein
MGDQQQNPGIADPAQCPSTNSRMADRATARFLAGCTAGLFGRRELIEKP